MRCVVALTMVAVLLGGCSAGDDAPASRRSPGGADRGPTDLALSAVAERAVQTATTLADGSVLVAGGCVVDGCTTATTTAALVTGDAVRRAADLGTPRSGHTATRLPDGRVLVVGGFAAEGTAPLATAETYDPAADRWTPAGSLGIGRGGSAAAALRNGDVLVAGGWVRSGTYTASTEIVDGRTGAVRDGPALAEAVDGLEATTLVDGSLLLTGGQVSRGVATAAAAVVSADGTTVTPVGRMATPRFKHASVRLPDGRVLVIGGTTDDRELLRSTEVFDPATRAFTAGPTLVAGRYKIGTGSVVLPDGRVAIAGGGPGVEVVDVAAGTSVPQPAAGLRRSSFSSLNLVGGDLLVLGGYDERIRLTRTALRLPLASLV